MDESLGVILRLFTEEEPITHRSDWFELREASLQLRPLPAASHAHRRRVGADAGGGSPLAGKHGAWVLTITVPREGKANLSGLWDIAEESAAEHGKTVDRSQWRLTIPVHLAEGTANRPLDEVRIGAGRYLREYTEGTNGREAAFDGPLEGVVDYMAGNGSWVVGTPDDCIEAIGRLDVESGGFGGLLVQTIDWAPREKMLKSFRAAGPLRDAPVPGHGGPASRRPTGGPPNARMSWLAGQEPRAGPRRRSLHQAPTLTHG